MSLLPFSILRLTPNPAFYQPLQPVSIGPVVGFSAVNYVVTAGTLPAGLTLNATTGQVTGTSSSLVPATMVTITATLANSTTTSTNLWISFIDEPNTAFNTNQNTGNSRSANALLLDQNFIADVASQIISQSELGLYYTFANLHPGANAKTLMNFFTSLNYTFSFVYPSQNGLNFISAFGQRPDYGPYSDFAQPSPIISAVPQYAFKVLIQWSQNSCPFWLFPYNYYGSYGSYGSYPTYCD